MSVTAAPPDSQTSDLDQTLAADDGYACAIRTDGSLACWGDLNGDEPGPPPTGTFRSVSAGHHHACGVKIDGSVACWGSNSQGQSTPPDGQFRSVVAGSEAAWGIRTNGSLAHWGSSWPVDTPPEGTFRAITGDSIATCGIKTDGTLSCWGEDTCGTTQPPAGIFRSIGGTFGRMCGVKDDGFLACWGLCDDGSSDFYPPDTPGLFYMFDSTYRSLGTVRSVSVGDLAACVIKSDGTLACWGIGYNRGALSPPTGTFRSVAVGATPHFACGTRDDGTLTCWGDNSNGQATPPAGTFR